MTKRIPTIGEVIASKAPSEKRQRHNQFFEAVLLGRYQIDFWHMTPAQAELLPGIRGYVNTESKWWDGGYDSAEFPPPEGATPELIVEFYDWYRKEHNDNPIELPKRREAIIANYADFIAWKIKRHGNGSQSQRPAYLDEPDKPRITHDAIVASMRRLVEENPDNPYYLNQLKKVEAMYDE
jgi:hypothetical protein